LTWIIFATLCAISEGIKDLISKHTLQKSEPIIISWVFFFTTSILCLPFFFFEDIPTFDNRFIIYLTLQGSLFGISIFLYMKAISLSPISLTLPLIMFTPVFLLFVSPFTTGEVPNSMGILGTLLIVIGSYLLNIKSITKGALEPIKALMRESGARLMLVVAFIWSITSTLDKVAIVHTQSPLIWGISVYLFVSFFLTSFLLFNNKKIFSFIIINWKSLLPIGIFNSIQLLSYVLAIQSGMIVYVLAIKRTSILIVIVLSALIFEETKIKERIIAVLVMLAGFACIVSLG